MAKNNQIETIVVEKASLRAEVRQLGELVDRSARTLRNLGDLLSQSLVEMRFDSDRETLCCEATRVRAAATHAVAVALELAMASGRLDQLADVHGADVSEMP